MSTKIYDAYIFDKNYSLYELNELFESIKKSIAEKAKKMKNEYIAKEYLYYCDYVKYFGKEKCREVYDSIKITDNISKHRSRIWDSLIKEDYKGVLRNIEWCFMEDVEHSGMYDPDFNYKATLQIIPLKDKLLAMYFGNYNLFGSNKNELPSFMSDYHYQNQTDKPDCISDKEWEERRKDWDEAIGPDYIPAKHGFTIELFNTFWDFGIFTIKDLINCECPTLEERAKQIVDTIEGPNFPKPDSSVSEIMHYFRTDEYQKWKNEKMAEIMKAIEPNSEKLINLLKK